MRNGPSSRGKSGDKYVVEGFQIPTANRAAWLHVCQVDDHCNDDGEVHFGLSGRRDSPNRLDAYLCSPGILIGSPVPTDQALGPFAPPVLYLVGGFQVPRPAALLRLAC